MPFKEVIGFTKYEIDEFGVVRRRLPPENTKFGISYVGKIIKPHLNAKKGRYTICLMRDDGTSTSTVYVHSLVAKTHLGPPPDETYQVDHIDGNKTNNHVSNLRWVTAQQNHQYATKMNLKARGERMGSSKLTETQVLDIRKRYASGQKQQQLADLYGVTQALISEIVLRKIWRHI